MDDNFGTQTFIHALEKEGTKIKDLTILSP
jgi:hypothetical protein